MKTIVALVDLSDLTFKVLKQAHHLALPFKAQVIILHVVPKEPVVIDMGIASPTVMQDPSPAAVQKQHAQLMEMRDSLAKFGVNAVVQQLEGASVETVLSEVKGRQADMVILGSHHHSTIYKWLIGSVTDDILKRAHCPVLVVPGDEDAK